ncbi:MAG: mechanosensitive ion channel family protein [Candidatus Cloacimonetes bacterium]|nr:mechanosensitive ion channel family protein [Candidatus Cloacimonadota bacterium]MDD3500934.1 mechanosensitive ion channel [Candidatus Cloacimonadota bacterium]
MNTIVKDRVKSKYFLSLILFLICFSFLFAETSKEQVEEGYPVFLNQKEIFRLYSGYQHISLIERVKIIESRFEAIKTNRKSNPDSLLIQNVGKDVFISYYGTPLVYITDDDVQVLKKDKMAIAEDIHDSIKKELMPLLSSLSLKNQIISATIIILLIALIVIATYYILRFINKIWHKTEFFVKRLTDKLPNGIHIRGVNLTSYTQVKNSLMFLVKLAKFLVYLFILYNAVYLILYVIPATQDIARQLQHYLTRPIINISRAFFDYLPNIFFIVVVLFIAKYVIKFLKYFFDELRKGTIKFKNFYPEWADSTFQIAKFLIYFFVIVIIFPYLPGSESPAFKGVSIFVGVLFSLGSSSAIANIVAGIILTYMRAFKIGDFVRIGNTQGELIESSLLVVKIKTFQNIEVTIPNSIVLGGQIFDLSRHSHENGLVLQLKVELGFDVPWTKVHELLIIAAKKTSDVLKDREPFVLQTALNESVVEYELNAAINDPFKMRRASSELYGNIVEIFNENNIDLICHIHNVVDLQK